MNCTVERMKAFPDTRDEGASRASNRSAVMAAVEELCLHLSLNLKQTLAESGFGHSDSSCRLGQVALFMQGHYQFEIAYLQLGCHRSYTSEHTDPCAFPRQVEQFCLQLTKPKTPPPPNDDQTDAANTNFHTDASGAGKLRKSEIFLQVRKLFRREALRPLRGYRRQIQKVIVYFQKVIGQAGIVWSTVAKRSA
jgi:hypothetical protein